jgi:hypothetical protein
MLGGAWYLGMTSRTPEVAPVSAGDALAALDQDLAQLPTPGQKLQRLRTVTSAPEGELEQRQRQVVVELQRSVDRVVDELAGPGWPELLAWLRDPAAWPDRSRAERERVQPRLVGEAGLLPGQLPTSVRLLRLEDLLRAIDRALVDRDSELLTRFEQHLAVKVPRVVDEHLRAHRFALAEKTWEEALPSWCNGVQAPVLERLSDALRRTLDEKRLRARNEARAGIDDAEAKVTAAMRGEVATVVEELGRQLAAGVEPSLIEASLQRFGKDLGAIWPPSDRFRPANNPWPDLERQLGVLQQAVALAQARVAELRFEQRCDLAWRAACHGGAVDALQLLADDTAQSPAQRAQLAAHRQALVALQKVEQAILAAIERSTQAPVGFLRSAPNEALELRVERDGERPRLVGAPLGQPTRPLRLHELRCSDLLQRLRRDRDPFAGLPTADWSFGVTVARLIGDDLDGLGELVGALARDDERFLVDELWPRILRVRQERLELPLDRQGLWTRVREAFAAARSGGSLTELDSALQAVTSLVPEPQRTPAEANELRQIEVWLRLGRRRRDLAAELGKAAPQQAQIDVRIDEDQLIAAVTLAGNALLAGAQEGWQRRDAFVEFGAGGRPWSELELQRLQVQPGFAQPAPRLSLQVDLVLPPSSVDPRFWLFDCCGIAFVVVLGRNDSVQAAFVDGDPRREDHAKRAFERAMAGLMLQPKVRAIPGAVHRLTVELEMTAGRRGARSRVAFEGVELAAETRPFDPDRAPLFTLYPRQDLAVAMVMMRAVGL